MAPRRALGLGRVRRLVDEGTALGFSDIFLTGGEPFVLADIYDMLAYALVRARTTILTNGTLLSRESLDRLCELANDRLTVQVSLDGARPEHNDTYRGDGTWLRAVEAIRSLRGRGLRVAISTTETPANAEHLPELRQFVSSLGVAEDDHFVRPLAKRGFSREGQEVGKHNLVPEVTISANGVYWHPLLSPSTTDMLVSSDIFPLTSAVEAIRAELASSHAAGDDRREEFT